MLYCLCQEDSSVLKCYYRPSLCIQDVATVTRSLESDISKNGMHKFEDLRCVLGLNERVCACVPLILSVDR